MNARLINRFRRQRIRRFRPAPDERVVLLSPGVAYLPEGACEASRRLAEEMGYEVREAGEADR